MDRATEQVSRNSESCASFPSAFLHGGRLGGGPRTSVGECSLTGRCHSITPACIEGFLQSSLHYFSSRGGCHRSEGRQGQLPTPEINRSARSEPRLRPALDIHMYENFHYVQIEFTRQCYSQGRTLPSDGRRDSRSARSANRRALDSRPGARLGLLAFPAGGASSTIAPTFSIDLVY